MAALYPVPMVQAADSGHAIYAGPVFSSCCEKKWLFSLTATNTRLRYHTLPYHFREQALTVVQLRIHHAKACHCRR